MNALEPAHAEVSARLLSALPRLRGEWQEDARIADLGLDSMDMVELLCVVHQDFGARLSEEELGGLETVGELIDLVSQKAQSI